MLRPEPMGLRIRQVKPDFWRDSTVGAMSDTTRLVYIGLWMEADDTGWLRLDVTTIAADLYPYSHRVTRERRVREAIEALVEARRIEVHPCGHALIRTLTRHQRLSAPEKRVQTSVREHERCLPTTPAGTRGDPRVAPGPVTGLDPSVEGPGTRGDPRGPAGIRGAPTRNGTGREREGTERGVQGGSAPRSLPIRINDDGSFEVTSTAEGPH
jgi:hypothetical protein